MLAKSIGARVESALPIAAVARLVGEHDTLIWRIVNHYVDAARAKADHSKVTHGARVESALVGVDETAAKRGQIYVSLFVDLEQRKVLFATPGKDSSTVAAFAKDLKAHGGDPMAQELKAH